MTKDDLLKIIKFDDGIDLILDVINNPSTTIKINDDYFIEFDNTNGLAGGGKIFIRSYRGELDNCIEKRQDYYHKYCSNIYDILKEIKKYNLTN